MGNLKNLHPFMHIINLATTSLSIDSSSEISELPSPEPNSSISFSNLELWDIGISQMLAFAFFNSMEEQRGLISDFKIVGAQLIIVYRMPLLI